MPLYGTIVVIKRSGVDGSQFPLTAKECLIGSGDNCDIRIRLPSVAPVHCELKVTEMKEVVLTNLDSNEPTILNDEELLTGVPITLKAGDIFTVADRSFRYEAAPRPRRASARKSAAAAAKMEEVNHQGSGGGSEVPAPELKSTPKLSGASTVFKAIQPTPSPRVTGVRRPAKEPTPKVGIPQSFKTMKSMTSPRLTSVRRVTADTKAAPKTSSKLGGDSRPPKTPRAMATPRSAGTPRRMENMGSGPTTAPKSVAVTRLVKTPQSLPRPRLQTPTKESTPKNTPKPSGVPKVQTTESMATPKSIGIQHLMEDPASGTTSSPNSDMAAHLFTTPQPVLLPGETENDNEGLVKEPTPETSPEPTESLQFKTCESMADPQPELTSSPISDEVSRLPVTPQLPSSPRVADSEGLMKEPMPKNTPEPSGGSQFETTKSMADPGSVPANSPKLDGVYRLLKTPKHVPSPRLAGIRRLMRKSTAKASPKLNGIPDLFKTTKSTASPRLAGVRKLMEENPSPTNSPKLSGVSRLFKTTQSIPSPRLAGIRRLMKEPTPQKSPKLNGIPQLFKSAKSVASPRLAGIRRLMEEHKPESDTSLNLDGVSTLFSEIPARSLRRRNPSATLVPTVVQDAALAASPVRKRGRRAAAAPKSTEPRSQSEEIMIVESPETVKEAPTSAAGGRALRNRKVLEAVPTEATSDLQEKKTTRKAKQTEVMEEKKPRARRGQKQANPDQTEEPEGIEPAKRAKTAKEVAPAATSGGRTLRNRKVEQEETTKVTIERQERNETTTKSKDVNEKKARGKRGQKEIKPPVQPDQMEETECIKPAKRTKKPVEVEEAPTTRGRTLRSRKVESAEAPPVEATTTAQEKKTTRKTKQTETVEKKPRGRRGQAEKDVEKEAHKSPVRATRSRKPAGYYGE